VVGEVEKRSFYNIHFFGPSHRRLQATNWLEHDECFEMSLSLSSAGFRGLDSGFVCCRILSFRLQPTNPSILVALLVHRNIQMRYPGARNPPAAEQCGESCQCPESQTLQLQPRLATALRWSTTESRIVARCSAFGRGGFEFREEEGIGAGSLPRPVLIQPLPRR